MAEGGVGDPIGGNAEWSFASGGNVAIGSVEDELPPFPRTGLGRVGAADEPRQPRASADNSGNAQGDSAGQLAAIRNRHLFRETYADEADKLDAAMFGRAAGSRLA